MDTFSHSRLSAFEQCPLKFRYKYIDKVPTEIETTIEAHLGSAVHDALEWIYNSVKNRKVPTIDEVITYYSVRWQDEFSDEVLIVKKDLTEKDYFNKGVQFLIDYYTKHYPFKDGTIECEKWVVIELHEEKGYKIQGVIDRLVYNLQTGEYEIHDYKTANSLPAQENIDKDRQLALYSLAIKNIYGKDKKVKLIWHFLAHKVAMTSKRTDEELENLKNETINLIEKIRNTREFIPKKSKLCSWCEYKSICPEWNSEK